MCSAASFLLWKQGRNLFFTDVVLVKGTPTVESAPILEKEKGNKYFWHVNEEKNLNIDVYKVMLDSIKQNLMDKEYLKRNTGEIGAF